MMKTIFILNKNYRKFIIKWTCVDCIRYRSSSESNTKVYSHTILFPKTDFPTRSIAAHKEEILKKGKFNELYDWQRQHSQGPEFVLHDGPPYANGDLHMGHAVNKIIKDINNRNQVLQGHKVHYTPGWDCHGLPIELKALQKVKKTADKNDLSNPVNVRKIARNFALETVEKQKASFKMWGVMANWDDCYLTLNNKYVQNQLKKFYEMHQNGYIFRALKPVYWSPSSRTALAEAELEYDPQYKSKEVYIKFPIEKAPNCLQDIIAGKKLFAIVWTTTPWTLIANRAICYGPTMRYSVVTLSDKPKGHLFLVGTALIESLQNILGTEIKSVLEFEGSQLKCTTYKNKLLNVTFPFLEGDHVAEGKGTGLVHTAPAHGPEDFLVALKNNMHVQCNVDESGRYTGLDQSLNGLYVLGDGQDAIIGQLGDDVIHHGVYVHSYPLDWRTKKPVILRASQQWFIDTDKLKNRALEVLEDVALMPPSGAVQHRQGFRAQLEKRPYWCISRQRAWGVPIPALYKDNEAIVDERIVDRLCDLMDKDGPDVWWTCDVKDLLPESLAKEKRFTYKDVTKGNDIMDIWLDSGLSWSALEGRQAHLYSEGVDQLTGWFQASLLTSLALKDRAPYSSIFVHGFVVDDKKRKMSKSIGNVIDPATVINGGKDKNSQPAYGVDTLRWWVASHATQHSQIVISKKLLDDCQQEVIRLRNILKYLLGAISDLERDSFDDKPLLNYFDEYTVSESYNFLNNLTDSYNNYKYNTVTQNILFFVSNKVSGLYCHCIKDRLYCSAKSSNERLSVQLTIHTILVNLLKGLGPILPHLVEEVWQHHPLSEKPFFFTTDLPILKPVNVDTDLMDTVLDIKKDFCSLVQNEALKKFAVKIGLESFLFEKLSKLNKCDGFNDTVLCELLEVSSVVLEEMSDLKGKNWLLDVSKSKKDKCLRCRKYNALDCSDKCLRCENVLLGM